MTGKEAMLAILEGTHWFTAFANRNRFKIGFFNDDLRFEKYMWHPELQIWEAINFLEYEIFRNVWTRGEPIESDK